jgi:hypothetical protein
MRGGRSTAPSFTGLRTSAIKSSVLTGRNSLAAEWNPQIQTRKADRRRLHVSSGRDINPTLSGLVWRANQTAEIRRMGRLPKGLAQEPSDLV